MTYILKCKNCGASDKFTCVAREFHTWVVNNRGEFIEDRGCDDTDSSDSEYFCMSCAGKGKDGFGEWVEEKACQLP